jgi:hypothetical protein
MTMKMMVGNTVRLGRKTIRDEELEQSCRALSKKLIRHIPYRIAKASGSRDPLSCSLVHAGARDEVDYGCGASSERHNLDGFQVFCTVVARQEFI